MDRNPEKQAVILTETESGKKYIQLRKKMVYELWKAGVPLMAGSDSPEFFLVQGFTSGFISICIPTSSKCSRHLQHWWLFWPCCLSLLAACAQVFHSPRIDPAFCCAFSRSPSCLPGNRNILVSGMAAVEAGRWSEVGDKKRSGWRLHATRSFPDRTVWYSSGL